MSSADTFIFTGSRDSIADDTYLLATLRSPCQNWHLLFVRCGTQAKDDADTWEANPKLSVSKRLLIFRNAPFVPTGHNNSIHRLKKPERSIHGEKPRNDCLDLYIS
jgi:hypothetical protein